MSYQNRFAFLNEQLAKLLATDPGGKARLAALEGRSLVLVNADLAFGVQVSVADGKLEVQSMAPADGTTRVVGGLAALQQLIGGRKLSVDALLNSCEVDGDIDEARLWFEALAGLRPDFAKPFAGILADEQLDNFVWRARKTLSDIGGLLANRPPRDRDD